MRGSRKVCQRGSNATRQRFFLVGKWIQIPINTVHHRPASETSFKWRFRLRADDGPGLVSLWFSRWSRPILLRNPFAVWCSRGGGENYLLPSSGSAHVLVFVFFVIQWLLSVQYQSQKICYNPFQTNGIFYEATYNKVRRVHFIYWGVTGYTFQK